MVLPILLSSLVGLALGLLGGGGSILLVPILIAAAALPAKTAIATSLLVVGVASLGALGEHIRAGRVRFRVGLGFGLAGMVGAYLGARVAAYVPANLLLVGFALMMAGTGFAMVRGRKAKQRDPVVDKPKLVRVVLDGVAVGFGTGLVGAGGGFMVVPALVLLGGLSMHEAVATSLLVVSMKSFAGFAGYVGHVPVDFALAASLAASATLTSFVGARLASRVPSETLRKGFGTFVLALSLPLLVSQLPPSLRESSLYRAIFVERWHFAISGLALASVVVAFLRWENRLLGVSTGIAELSSLGTPRRWLTTWRIPLLLGIVLGGVASSVLGNPAPGLALAALETTSWTTGAKLVTLGLAGALMGFGARRAGGCTSGHSIVGVAQGAKSSMVATAVFMLAGLATTQLFAWLVSRS